MGRIRKIEQAGRTIIVLHNSQLLGVVIFLRQMSAIEMAFGFKSMQHPMLLVFGQQDIMGAKICNASLKRDREWLFCIRLPAKNIAPGIEFLK